MSPSGLNPEQQARQTIDANLRGAGWLVQDRAEANLSAGRGAIMAPISMFEWPMRMMGAFSQRQPPCMVEEIIFTGADTFTR